MAVCSPLVAKSGPTGAEHVARSYLDRYALFLIQLVIIKCEIQCSYKRAIQGGPKRTERHTSGNNDIKLLVSVDGLSSPEKNDTKISHFG